MKWFLEEHDGKANSSCGQCCLLPLRKKKHFIINLENPLKVNLICFHGDIIAGFLWMRVELLKCGICHINLWLSINIYLSYNKITTGFAGAMICSLADGNWKLFCWLVFVFFRLNILETLNSVETLEGTQVNRVFILYVILFLNEHFAAPAV